MRVRRRGESAWTLTDELIPALNNGGLWLRLMVLTATATAVALWWRQADQRATLGSVQPPGMHAVKLN